MVEVKVDKENVSLAYVRKPNRIHIARAMSFVGQGQKIEAGECILDDTWLGGDARCKSITDKDTEFRIGLAWALFDNVTIFEAAIKNV